MKKTLLYERYCHTIPQSSGKVLEERGQSSRRQGCCEVEECSLRGTAVYVPASSIGFGNQTIFLCEASPLRKTLGFASPPRGRFAFIRAQSFLKNKPLFLFVEQWQRD